MGTMIFVSAVIYAIWLRYNRDLLLKSAATFLTVMVTFVAAHGALVSFVVATGWPLNTIAGIVASIFLMYSFFGFWPHLEAFHIRSIADLTKVVKDPRRGISLAIILSDALGVVRLIHWDVVAPFSRVVDGGSILPSTAEAVVFNFGLSLWATGVAVLTLALLYYLIPEDKREGWCWLTSPFYPERPKILTAVFKRR